MPPEALAAATARRHELTRAKAIQALRELDRAWRASHLRIGRRHGRDLPVLAIHPARLARPDPGTARRRRAARPRAARTPAGQRSIPPRPAHRRPRPQQAARRGKHPFAAATRPGPRRPAVSTAPIR